MSDGSAARSVAARVLEAVQRGRSLKVALGEALPALEDPRDRALVEAIVFAALRERARFDAVLAAWMAKPPGARDGLLRALLHVGLVQLATLGLPAHAAVDATVAAARALGRAHQAGLVNALLRRATREGVPPGDPAQAWPPWLLAMLRADWPEHLDAILAASAAQAPLWLRVNRRMATRDAHAARLAEAGIAHRLPQDVADAIVLDQPLPVELLPGFAEGAVSVQDGSAQQVADALQPDPEARVLDACAAPGGKAAHLAERDPTLAITALDVDARRVRRMREGFARLRLDIASLTADAAAPASWWDGQLFDAILIDAPCSATGIVRRQPDILLHRRREDLDALLAAQARLLDALWPLLRPGGTLLYATCSILRAENEAQVRTFLARTPEAAIDPLDARFGLDTGFGSQRLPGSGGMDGFFHARLRKTG